MSNCAKTKKLKFSKMPANDVLQHLFLDFVLYLRGEKIPVLNGEKLEFEVEWNEDGTFNKTISPIVMERIAASFSFDMNNRETQLLDGLRVYPTTYLLPRKKYPRTEKTFAEHRIYGSWRKRKLSRQIDLKITHILHIIKYALFKR